MCYNCLDRHILAGRGPQAAFIYDSPLTGKVIYYTYSEVLEKVQQLSGALLYKYHIKPGDRVVLYMPLIPEALITMLACARVGAIHSVVFGGFAYKELANRLCAASPKLIFTADAGIEPRARVPYTPILDKACEYAETQGLAHAQQVPRVIVDRGEVELTLKPQRDSDFYELLRNSDPFKSVVSVSATHPLYVLYTSGTTGTPKGILRDTGGYATALLSAMD